MATIEENDKLTLQQHNAINALLTHRDVASSAKAAGIPERSLYRWVNENKEFQAALKKAEAQMFTGLVRRLNYLGAAALDVLGILMADQKTPPSTRAAAARTILDNLIRLKELAVLDERITALELTLFNNNEAGEEGMMAVVINEDDGE